MVSAVYDATQSTLPVDYSYAQYPNQTDASQNYSQYMYPSEYTADGTWIAQEQRENANPPLLGKLDFTRFIFVPFYYSSLLVLMPHPLFPFQLLPVLPPQRSSAFPIAVLASGLAVT